MKLKLETLMNLKGFIWYGAMALLVSAAVFPLVVVPSSRSETASADTPALEGREASGVVDLPGETAITAASSYGQDRYRFVRCNSTLRRRRTCDTWGRNPVKLWRRHSASGCDRRRDWNTMDGGRRVWVDNGCQATFRVRSRY